MEEESKELALPHDKIAGADSRKVRKATSEGIVYLSRIPTQMTVKIVRQLFGRHGELGRVFLQPDDKCPEYKKNRSFTEGWVEFQDKRVAKHVALSLNNTQIGGKRRYRWYDEIWNIKYLPKFKWGHLNERLAYEREVHKQRLRTEVAQAKKETSFYLQNVEKRKVLERKAKKAEKRGEATPGEEVQEQPSREWSFKQKDTEDEILAKKAQRHAGKGQPGGAATGKDKKRKREESQNTVVSAEAKRKKASLNRSFLKNIFSGGGKDGFTDGD